MECLVDAISEVELVDLGEDQPRLFTDSAANSCDDRKLSRKPVAWIDVDVGAEGQEV